MSCSDAAHTVAAAKAIKESATKSGWQIVGEETHPMGATDYSALMRDVAASGAQVIFWWDCKPEVGIGIKQWYDMKVPAMLFGFLNPLDEPSAWESMEGKVISTMQFNGEGGCLPDTNLTPLTRSSSMPSWPSTKRNRVGVATCRPIPPCICQGSL